MNLRKSSSLFLFLAWSVAACAPERGAAYEKSLAAANRASHAGRYAEAATQFDEAAKTAKVQRDGVYARYLAAKARIRSGDVTRGAAELRELANAKPPNDYSGAAAYDAAIVTLDADPVRGQSELEDVLVRFPSNAVARLSLGRLLRIDTEAGGPAKVLARIDHLTPRVPAGDPKKPGVEEMLAYERARALAQQGNDGAARDAFVDVAKRWPYPIGGYFDDALYRASELDEKLGQPEKAVEHLEELLSRRENSVIVGSYERPRYSPAALRIADLYEGPLHDRSKARDTLHRFYRDFPRSVMRDDALWHEADLWQQDGDRDTACSRLSTLVSNSPDSRYVPCASQRCPKIARPEKSKAPKECRPYIERGYWAARAKEESAADEAPSSEKTNASTPTETKSAE